MEECRHGIYSEWCSICKKHTTRRPPAPASVRSHTTSRGETKQDVLDDITKLLGISPRKVSVGSSIPSEVFTIAASRVNVSSTGPMPEVLERIIQTSGGRYSTSFDSRGTASGGGSTVTLDGIKALRSALRRVL